MQSQQNKFHIFLSHTLITMHFPSLAKAWIKYILTEKVFKHDMQLHQTVDLKIESTPNFISSDLEL
jgi:hypothetical protein